MGKPPLPRVWSLVDVAEPVAGFIIYGARSSLVTVDNGAVSQGEGSFTGAIRNPLGVEQRGDEGHVGQVVHNVYLLVWLGISVPQAG